jgi:L-lactate utilization protein LutB
MAINKNQTTENCNLCGWCNLNCPIYAILFKESAGPRFKAFLEKKNELKGIFFLCTECGTCAQDCPAKIEIGCLKTRKSLVDAGFETPANKIMRENIKRSGNSLGELKKGTKTKAYYT